MRIKIKDCPEFQEYGAICKTRGIPCAKYKNCYRKRKGAKGEVNRLTCGQQGKQVDADPLNATAQESVLYVQEIL